MKALVFAVLAASMCACGRPESSYDFVISGATGRVSDRAAMGLVDNTGALEIHDAAWHIGMTLGGLAEGIHQNVPMTFIDKTNAQIFSTDNGGTCSVFVDPHDTTNGSAFSGHFTCTGLGDGSGGVVDVNGVEFLTYISDAANNPDPGPPAP